jgi:single-strand DNA-binding protein
VWGAQGENAARYLSKGRPVAIDGRLEWREWQTEQGGKRQAVEIIADTVQFLGSPQGGGSAPASEPQGDFGAPTSEGSFGVPSASGATAEDDIPF